METSAIVALTFGLLVLAIIVFTLAFSNSFGNSGGVRANKEIWFSVQKWLLILFVLMLNAGGCVLVYYTQNLQVILFIIVVLKSKDIIMSVMFVFNMIYCKIAKKYTDLPPVNLSDEMNNILAFIPTYNESFVQIDKVLTSILNSKSNTNNILPVIVSDGKNDYSSLFTKINTKEFMYESWKKLDVKINVVFGTFNGHNVVYIQKDNNVGKKDSIILINDLFNFQRTNFSNKNQNLRYEFKNDVLENFGINEIHYIFNTDADTIVDENAINCLVDTMKTKNAIACAGVANVDKSNSDSYWFWNNLQNYQYLYGQYIRRTNEDLMNQVLCLPGCISMLKVSEEFINIMNVYSTLPNEKNLVECCVQSIGTDRRLTSSIIYTTDNAVILQDTRAHAYTIPPQNFAEYVSQRKRWTHNTFFNSIFNIIGPNVNILLRLFNLIDVLRMCFVYFRMFNTFYFIYLLADFYEPQNVLKLVPYIVLLSYPVVCFLVYSLFNSHLRNQYIYILLFTFINKLFSMFTTIIIFTVMLFNIGDYNWQF